MYKCRHFTIKEIVNPAFLKLTSEAILWSIFDERLLKLADAIREQFGSIIINGGGLTDCGLRQNDSATGAGFSAHKYGRALDLHICSIENKKLDKPAKTSEYEKLRVSLLSNTAFNILNFETNIYWLHIDTFNRQNRTFKP
ncbi:MAG: hypothetical protein LBH29_04315 [Elusimicrobiota bacterium]|jgi:hypothetical protein|nr:hypothetical protein [Elusimicrobiota bacterium]